MKKYKRTYEIMLRDAGRLELEGACVGSVGIVELTFEDRNYLQQYIEEAPMGYCYRHNKKLHRRVENPRASGSSLVRFFSSLSQVSED